jgi:hypothetical protein
MVALLGFDQLIDLLSQARTFIWKCSLSKARDENSHGSKAAQKRSELHRAKLSKACGC